MTEHKQFLARFNSAVSAALSRTMSHYLQYVPAVIWTWFAVEVVVPMLDFSTSIALMLLLPTCLIGYAAAAAKASGRCREGVMQLYLTRLAAILDFWWLYSIFLIGSLFLTIALSFFGNINHGGFVSDMLPSYVVLFILICTRCWPMIVAPFSSASQVQPASIWWKLPGLGHAWLLTRRKKTFLHLTAPLFITGGLIFGGYLVLRPTAESFATLLLILNIALYGIVLPFFITLIDILAEQLEPDTGQLVGLNTQETC